MKSYLICLFVFYLYKFLLCNANFIEIHPTQDTVVNSSHKNVNYGTSTTLSVLNDKTIAFIQFEIPFDNITIINDAKIFLYKSNQDQSNVNISLYVDYFDWNEYNFTYNDWNQSKSDFNPIGTISGPSQTSYSLQIPLIYLERSFQSSKKITFRIHDNTNGHPFVFYSKETNYGSILLIDSDVNMIVNNTMTSVTSVISSSSCGEIPWDSINFICIDGILTFIGDAKINDTVIINDQIFINGDLDIDMTAIVHVNIDQSNSDPLIIVSGNVNFNGTLYIDLNQSKSSKKLSRGETSIVIMSYQSYSGKFSSIDWSSSSFECENSYQENYGENEYSILMNKNTCQSKSSQKSNGYIVVGILIAVIVPVSVTCISGWIFLYFRKKRMTKSRQKFEKRISELRIGLEIGVPKIKLVDLP